MFEPSAFHPRRPGLVTPVRTDRAAVTGPTPKQVRGKSWRQSSYGYHVPASVPTDDPQQRIVEASVLLPPDDGVTGWAALNWLGGRWFNGASGDGSPLPVPIVVSRYVAAQPGVQVSQEHLRHREVVVVDGLPITLAVRALCFETRYARTDRLAVVALDMAAYSDLVSVEEARAYTATLTAWTGVGRAREAVRRAEENSWSPQESVMRQVWTDEGGRPRPLCNVPVFDRGGRHVGTPDLLDPVAGVVGEYDGALHLVGSQRAEDVRREGRLRELGLEYVVMLAADHADGYRSFVARLDAAYRRARVEAESARRWTLTPPPWWTDTSTVAARRSLPPYLRDRLLRHRRAA